MNKKMQIERLEKNELHKQLEICFGSVANSGRGLLFSEKSPYLWINGKTKWPPRHKLAKGFRAAHKELDKLEEMLSPKI